MQLYRKDYRVADAPKNGKFHLSLYHKALVLEERKCNLFSGYEDARNIDTKISYKNEYLDQCPLK